MKVIVRECHLISITISHPAYHSIIDAIVHAVAQHQITIRRGISRIVVDPVRNVRVRDKSGRSAVSRNKHPAAVESSAASWMIGLTVRELVPEFIFRAVRSSEG